MLDSRGLIGRFLSLITLSDLYSLNIEYVIIQVHI